MFISHLYVFFGEMSVYFFGPFFGWVVYFLVLSCTSCLYIFEINFWSVASFPIIFSHSEGWLFTLLIVSFVVQKLLSLLQFSSVQSLSHVQLCDPMNGSTPGLPVHHQLPEFTQTHIHQVSDCHPAISSSVVPFSFCPQSLPALESFPMNQPFT